MAFVSEAVKILWGSPLPPIRSGVADYAVEILPELAGLARLRVLAPPQWRPAPGWPPSIEVVGLDAAPDPDERLVLHLGNNPYHVPFLDRLRDGDAVAVAHDVVLHHLLVEATLASGDADGYARELAKSHGAAGQALAAARRVGLTGHLDPFLYPARQSVLAPAKAIVVHSAWAAATVRRELPTTPVGLVGLPVVDPGPVDRIALRRRLGLDPDEIVVMHLGFLTPEKGLADIVTGVAAAASAGLPVRLMVVGEGRAAGDLRRAVVGTPLEDRVTSTGWIEPERFPAAPAAADLGVVLRTPSAGETSSAVLRFLACGVPVAVSGLRQFLEWPELAAPRLTPGPSAAAELARLVSRVRQPGWTDRRLAAREAYEAGHQPAAAARQLVEFVAGLR